MSFEMFPGHNRVAAISESFALNLIISVPLNNCLLHYNAEFLQNFLLYSVKLIE